MAVHAGFDVLDTVAHTLLALNVDAAGVHVVQPSVIPNASWLRPGTVSRNQQKFGDDLLDQRPLVVVPSVVSTRSWNLLIDVDKACRVVQPQGQRTFGAGPPVDAGCPFLKTGISWRADHRFVSTR